MIHHVANFFHCFPLLGFSKYCICFVFYTKLSYSFTSFSIALGFTCIHFKFLLFPLKF